MTILFARPRFEYASYRDFYALIDLSGFDWCYIDEIDPSSDNTYIITILNGELPEGGYPDARAKLVLWDLEYHLDNPPRIPGVEVWAADQWYAEQIGAKYVPMGSHPGLRETVTDHTKPIDVAFIGFITGIQRREVIRQQLIERGVKVSPLVAWGTMRDLLLNDSHAYLHIHQHAHIPAVPPLRMVVAAAYSLPVITETCADAGVFHRFLIQADYEHIPEQVIKLYGFETALIQNGAALHQFLCHNYTFRMSVEAGL